MQVTLEHRAPPGRKVHIIVSTYNGGNATQPRAPGHERPRAASSDAARHGRLSAASTAPGADIPCAPSARAPGQYCQSAAQQAPGHGRPLASTAGKSCRDRPSAAPIATVSSPAGPHRLRQEDSPRTPATPNTQTSPQTHRDTTHARTDHSQAPVPLSPCTAGGLQGGQLRSDLPYPLSRDSGNPPLSKCWRGAGGEVIPSPNPTHQVHPAIQVPPQLRSCSTAATGGLRQHPSRAPPLPTPSLCIAGGP